MPSDQTINPYGNKTAILPVEEPCSASFRKGPSSYSLIKSEAMKSGVANRAATLVVVSAVFLRKPLRAGADLFVRPTLNGTWPQIRFEVFLEILTPFYIFMAVADKDLVSRHRFLPRIWGHYTERKKIVREARNSEGQHPA
jgi:hypothetical protein